MNEWKSIFWLVVFVLLLVPVSNSFYLNTKQVIKSYGINADSKELYANLTNENKSLYRKIRYYKTKNGQKSLVKEKLNKVEDDELLIKFK